MRRSIRLAAPAVAVASVMLLGACGSDDDDSGGSIQIGDLQGGGDSGSEEGGSGEGGSDDGSANAGGGSTSNADLEGSWMSGAQPPYHVITVMSGSISLVDDTLTETCTGTVNDGQITMTCESGSNEFTSGNASVSNGTLTVVWDSGTQETYQRSEEVLGDLGNFDDLGDMGDMGDLGDMEDLGGSTF